MHKEEAQEEQHSTAQPPVMAPWPQLRDSLKRSATDPDLVVSGAVSQALITSPCLLGAGMRLNLSHRMHFEILLFVTSCGSRAEIPTVPPAWKGVFVGFLTGAGSAPWDCTERAKHRLWCQKQTGALTEAQVGSVSLSSCLLFCL